MNLYAILFVMNEGMRIHLRPTVRAQQKICICVSQACLTTATSPLRHSSNLIYVNEMNLYAILFVIIIEGMNPFTNFEITRAHNLAAKITHL